MDKKKQSKEDINTIIQITNQGDGSLNSNTEYQSNLDQGTEELLRNQVGNKAVENIKQIFEKTKAIKKVADVKHKEIQSQFKELHKRLNQSSECLQRMKKGIDNIKFSYQTKVFEMQKALTPGDFFDPEKNPLQTKEDMARHMDEIKEKIEQIQKQINAHKEKQQRRHLQQLQN
ncbi:hypothetical protein GWI33_011201 [Rhynchophorus ferrugineus]|uniref:Uncharacterized protein n=1 Tax=Rhynchophorus ferrugineus TaxID=354439 RepID=A0A834I8E5_RHYFE|nr:hypothetical protein GWI33_011201 [Rhynchophorus ferrugineus]